jgi:rubrerythrin
VDILEMAEQIERNGQAFYSQAAKRFASIDQSAILSELAKMEKHHEQTFRNMRREEGGLDPQLSPYDRDHEAAKYLEALANAKIFRADEDVSEVLSGYETLEDVLEEAQTREKDSVIFYLGLRDIVPTEEDKALVDRIIHEEMDHIRQLYELSMDLG